MINNANDSDNIVREKIRKNEMLRCSTYISMYFSSHGKIYKIGIAVNVLNEMKRIFRFCYAMLGNRSCSQRRTKFGWRVFEFSAVCALHNTILSNLSMATRRAPSQRLYR